MLRPYTSMLMLECPDGQGEAAFALLWEFAGRASRNIRLGEVAVVASGLSDIQPYPGSGRGDPRMVDQIDALIYRTTRPPSWAQSDSAYADTTNQLVVILRRRNLLALHCESGLRDAVIRRLARQPQVLLRLVPGDLLQGAFLRGAAKVLWMRGAHSPRAVRPDAKQLSGSRLQDALNPLDDSTFAMVSAKAALPPQAGRTALAGNVGTTPGKATVWNGPTQSFDEFVTLVTEVMTEIEETSATGSALERPYPILALETGDLSAVAEAYDIACAGPESLPGEPDVNPDLAGAAATLDRAVMIVHGQPGSAGFIVDVGLDGAIGGSLQAQATISAGRVRYAFGPHGAATNPVPVRQVLDALEEFGDDLITVYYDSGHTVTGGRIMRQDVRPEPFMNWDFRDFAGYSIIREKPEISPQLIHDATGQDQDHSLFGWVARNYASGYLICDDSPGEICDFVHLGHDASLSYIHVKAASTSNPARGVAVGAYEVIASQAVKNLLALSIPKLREHLEKPPVDRPACWTDGQRVDGRGQFLDALQYHGPRDGKRVVLIQPHMSKPLLDRLREPDAAATATANLGRLQLLETLLNAARGAAISLGGDLTAIGTLL